MKFLTDDLVRSAPFEYSEKEKQGGGAFCEALSEELRFHYENNPLYRGFCDNKGFDPADFNGDLNDIPPVHVSVFKELGSSLNSVPHEDIRLTLQSSATSGVPSSIPVDQITSKRQARAMVKVIGSCIGNERVPFLVMDVDPSSGFREILGARYAAVSGYLNFASDASYFLKVNENNIYYFDTEGITRRIGELNGQRAVIFGFTYILYSEVMRPLADKGIRFSLPEGSRLIHIGGWKKLESEKISREEFNSLAARLFGISETDVIDIYGFTEQMGLNYPDCPCGCKHVPLYSEVIVRDVMTKKVLPPGEEGLLEFITPIPHSYPGNAVLTDDIGTIVPGECPYGRAGTRFKVIGRLKKAEIRGCGDILSSKLKFAGADDAAAGSGRSSDIRVYYCGAETESGLSAAETIRDLEKKLRDGLEWIREQPVDVLIGLIAKVSRKWTSGPMPENAAGLQFLTSWCQAENLTRVANEGLRGDRAHADRFIPADDNAVRLLRATSRGLVCHWLAGNVIDLGMYVLVQSILTKNVNLLRVSSRDNGEFRTLLNAFMGETFTTAGGYTVAGSDLLKTIAVVSFDHANRAAGEAMSAAADVRIAWGGREAVTAVTAYPSKYDCEDIIMGPKLSMSVVSKEAIGDGRRASKLARKIAVDASVFDQTGCASTHNVFVERGSDITPEDFAEYIAKGMTKVALQIPKEAMTPEEFAAIHSARGVFDFKGKVFGDDDSVWTVLYEDAQELCAPVYSRVVFVHPVDDIDDALEFVTGDIQTIGLAASGGKAARFATEAAKRGAVRFPVCGRMLNFESPWDGMFIMDRMVRWNTLGGPLL